MAAVDCGDGGCGVAGRVFVTEGNGGVAYDAACWDCCVKQWIGKGEDVW